MKMTKNWPPTVILAFILGLIERGICYKAQFLVSFFQTFSGELLWKNYVKSSVLHEDVIAVLLLRVAVLYL